MTGNWVLKPGNDTAIVFAHGFLGNKDLLDACNRQLLARIIEGLSRAAVIRYLRIHHRTDIFSGS